MSMGHAKRQDQRKSQRTGGGSSLRDGYGGTGVTAPVGPSRGYGLRGNGPPTSVTEDQVSCLIRADSREERSGGVFPYLGGK